MSECKCTMREKSLGDGCMICNTEYFIESLPTPEELCGELDSHFVDSQAYAIASDVYQPLLALIETLNDKIKRLEVKSNE